VSGVTAAEAVEPSRLKILLLCDNHPAHAATLHAHVECFERYSRHAVTTFNPCYAPDVTVPDPDEYDVVVLHWSLVITMDSYLSPALRARLAASQGLKVQFIQDEHRWVNEVTSMMRYLGVHVIFTVAPPSEAPKLYGDRVPGAEVVHTLTGFVPEELVGLEVPPPSERPIDIGYRGRQLPYWGGARTQEKVLIGERVLERAAAYGLRCDIAWTEESRLYGEAWFDFLLSCKAVLGTSSGASIADYDGRVEREVRAFLEERPAATFAEVHDTVLRPYEGNIDIDVVSPRIFEAAATRTALVLFPGRYSGIVKPWVHYFPLALDAGNLEEVARCVRDAASVTRLTDRAYDDLVGSGRYALQAFVREFDAIVERSV